MALLGLYDVVISVFSRFIPYTLFLKNTIFTAVNVTTRVDICKWFWLNV